MSDRNFEFLKWDADEYGLGVPEMDHEHQGLVALINELARLARDRAEREELRTAMTKFIIYAKMHFRDEENLMKKILFPFYQEHRAAHELLMRSLNEFFNIVDTGAGILPRSFFIFLRNWLLDHINSEDRLYAEYHRRQSKVASPL